MSVFKDIADKMLKRGAADDGQALPPIKDSADQSPDEIKLVEFVRRRIDQTRQSNSRLAIESIYMTNVAYLLGFSGVTYDTTYRQFKNADPKRRISRNVFKINKILPNVQNRLSRLTQSPPRFDVRPDSNTSEDKDAARLGIKVIEDVFDKQRFNEKRQDLLMSCMQGGIAYVRVLWDPSLGEPMADPEKVMPAPKAGGLIDDATDGDISEADSLDSSEKLEGYEGDVRLEVLNCLEVFPDPLAKNLDDAAWCIVAKVRKLDYFKSRYGERGEAVKEEDAWLLSSMYDLKSNALSSVGITSASTQDQMKNSAIEIIYQERRSETRPNGRYVAIAGGILLEDKDLPVGKFDLVKFDDVIVGGRYNSEAVITHLRPIQDHYTMMRTKCADWIRQTLGGKYLVAKGAGLQQETLNNGQEVVEYDPVPNAPPPEAMQIPQIPSYVYKDIELTDGEFNEVSGINEISKGVLPSAGIPAAGMAFLQEQDQTRIGVQTTRNEIGYARVGELILRFVGKYYVMPRLLKLAGDGLEYTVKSFVGADLRNNFDVIVIEGSTIPSSKVLRRQDIMTAFTSGLMGNPTDPKVRAKVFKDMEYGNSEDLWKDQALDSQCAKRELNDIEAGRFPKFSEFDNHAFILGELNDYRKTDKYRELDLKRQGIFHYVFEWHIQALVNLQNPGLAQQQMMAELATRNLAQMTQPGIQPGPMAPPSPPPGAPGPGGPPPPGHPAGPPPGAMPGPGGPDVSGAPTSEPMAQAPVPNATPPVR